MFRAILLVASISLVSAQPVRLTITTPIVVNSIDNRIFGQSVTAGIWGEVVRNGRFAERAAAGGPAQLATKNSGIPLPAAHWYAVGAVDAALEADALHVIARDAEARIEQPGIAFRGGDTLRGTLRAGAAGQAVTVRLVDGAKVLAGATSPDLVLTPSANASDATLQILLPRGSDLTLEELSLMPDSTRPAGGFHPDLLQALTALHPPILRWSAENWKTAAFGAEQFLALAQTLNSQPVVAIPSSFTPQQAQELIRFCDPHHVKYIDRGGLVTEWRAASALDVAAAILGLERDSKVTMAAPAPGAVIDFAQRPWKPTPAYAAMKFLRDHAGIDVLKSDGDVVATRTADGRTIYIQAVNPKPAQVDLEVTLRGDFPLLAAALEVLPNDATRPIPAPVERTGLTVRFHLPGQSIGIATLLR